MCTEDDDDAESESAKVYPTNRLSSIQETDLALVLSRLITLSQAQVEIFGKVTLISKIHFVEECPSILDAGKQFVIVSFVRVASPNSNISSD